MIERLILIKGIRERLNNRQLFYMFCFALGLIGLTDSVMSYYLPIASQGVLGSNLAVGLMLGLSNLVALVCDFVFPELFKKKGWKFLLLGAVLVQIALPTFTFIGVITSFGTMFVLATIFWNIYYELFCFSRHNFIISNEKPENFSKDWSVISMMMGFMAIIGPIIGSEISKGDLLQSIVTVSVIQALAVIASFLVAVVSPDRQNEHKLHHRVQAKLNVLKELKLWEVLGTRVFPILVLGSMNTIIVAAVYTVGGLLGTQILGAVNLDWMLIFMFAVPGIFSAMFLSRFTFKKYKKLLSQVMLLLAAAPLVVLPIVRNEPWLVIVAFFLCSFFLSMSWIFNEAVFSDLSKRAGENDLYVNALERVNDSMGYLIGPIIIGFLADKTGYFWSFALLGCFAMLVALILIVTTPRKILIPQQELDAIENAKYPV